MNDILRRGRLGSEEDTNVLKYLSSMDADINIFEADLLVDAAHVIMLSEVGIITWDECTLLLVSLEKIQQEGFRALDMSYEDIHVSIETRLIEMIGEDIGGRMHSARSRNDEVATCIRLTLREKLIVLIRVVNELRKTLLLAAREHRQTIMPGFTHLQHAQPTTLGHHLLAYHDAFARDYQRLFGVYIRTNLSPLGAAAFASTGFDINRERTRELLGFDGLIENSMDAVSTRDFIIESVSTFSNVMTNLSRIAEELILWSTEEFNFIELDDRFASTSSIMPQKKNPDTAELIRAKTGTVHGCLMSVLSINKALPMSYNRDMQEITPHLWNATAAVTSSTQIVSGILSTMKINTENMLSASKIGFTTATELADTIVRTTELSFRTAHRIVGTMARSSEYTLEEADRIAMQITGIKLSEEGLTQQLFEEAMDIRHNIDRRDVVGGPMPREVCRMIEDREYQLTHDIDALEIKVNTVRDAMKRLEDIQRLLIARVKNND
jgi:argininosuccinate lyase